MKKLENLLKFEDFEKSWKSKEQKKTKRTEIGLDVIDEKRKFRSIHESNLQEDDEIIDNEDIMDDEIENQDNPIEDSDWQEQLKSLIDEIVEGGEDANEVFEFIEDYMEDEYGTEDDDEGSEDEDLDDEIEDEDLEDDEIEDED